MINAALLRSAAAAALALGVSVAPALAQDFMLGTPKGSFTLRAGAQLARAHGDVFDMMTDVLTLERSDFRAPLVHGEIAVRASPRLEATLGLGASFTERRSEYRDFVEETDAGDRPIRQSTRFRQVPITLGARAYLLQPGEAIGRFAWIPAAVVPYVGAGAGAVRYALEQEGDFVDFEDLSIFTGFLRADGWARATHLLGGVAVRVGTQTLIEGEARYQWAAGDPGPDFQGFDRIDLSGVAATMGFTIRF